MERFLDIISGKSKISLRIIDWFVNSVKRKNIVYYINQGSEGRTNGSKKGSNKRKRVFLARYQENAPDKVNNSFFSFLCI